MKRRSTSTRRARNQERFERELQELPASLQPEFAARWMQFQATPRASAAERFAEWAASDEAQQELAASKQKRVPTDSAYLSAQLRAAGLPSTPRAARQVLGTITAGITAERATLRASYEPLLRNNKDAVLQLRANHQQLIARAHTACDELLERYTPRDARAICNVQLADVRHEHLTKLSDALAVLAETRASKARADATILATHNPERSKASKTLLSLLMSRPQQAPPKARKKGSDVPF